MNVMSKMTFAPKQDRNTEQSLENGKKSTINTRYWLSLLQNENEITLVSDLKHTNWRSLVSIFEHVYSCLK